MKKPSKNQIATGVVHEVPADLEGTLLANSRTLELWNSLTPLARNEWICWITSVKKDETRAEHIERMTSQLEEGKRRPCCWPGCPHRNPNAAKWFKGSKKSKI
ncbi:MAG: YdeI/OmpD-associated family protein [Candidatus Altimarinota bacterium]